MEAISTDPNQTLLSRRKTELSVSENAVGRSTSMQHVDTTNNLNISIQFDDVQNDKTFHEEE